MIVDSSALVEIIRHQPAAEACARAIESAPMCRISAATYVEAAIVADRCRDPVIRHQFDELLRLTPVRIEPVTEAQARMARDAYRDFGKGGGHPARLNFGDCFSYALAKALNEPLLFVGNDFLHTDVRCVLDA